MLRTESGQIGSDRGVEEGIDAKEGDQGANAVEMNVVRPEEVVVDEFNALQPG